MIFCIRTIWPYFERCQHWIMFDFPSVLRLTNMKTVSSSRLVSQSFAPMESVREIMWKFHRSFHILGLSGLSLAKNIEALQITCDSVYQMCKGNAQCSDALKPVIQYCDFHMCNQNACLDALQTFYRISNEDFTLDVAFCVCKWVIHDNNTLLCVYKTMKPLISQSRRELILFIQ